MDDFLSKHYMTLKEVIRLTNYCKSSIYIKIKKGGFPKPYKLGITVAVWKKSEVLEWMKNARKRLPWERDA